MNAKTTFFTHIIITSLIITSLTIIPRQALTFANSGRNIDLFTQKAPFDGKGPNQPSDSFQPQELVILYALVTYNEAPVANKLVAFQINGPANSIQNITIIASSITNESGVAGFSFRIPWPAENAEEIVFGEWYAIATVDIADIVVVDTLTFQVGWIIRIKNIIMLNDQLNPQTNFLRQSTIIFDLTLENIALTSKTATITIDAQDVAEYPIIHRELYNLILQPCENHIQTSSQIPVNARIGEAKVSAIAYTAPPASGGTPYSPAVYATFNIITRDIAIISLVPSKTIAKIGETIAITATVKNKGNKTESFDVKTYYNQTLIQKIYVTALPPSTESQVIFSWNTSNLPEGDYIITAIADPVEGEIEVADNKLVDGVVKLYPFTPPIIHDVAVTSVNAQPLEVEIGKSIQIIVYVKNLGDVPESFNVTLFYDNFPITVLHVDFLAPSTEQKLTFIWNTSDVMEGNYTIKAYIPPVPDEQIITNNWCTDGTVWIKAPQLPVKRHDVAIIAVNASKHQAYIGDIVEITVKAANLGDFAETFNVTAYANMFKLGVRNLVLLDVGSNTTLRFIWDTSSMEEGSYTMWAFADTVLGEIDTANNVLVDDKVTLLTPPISYIHDIAVVSVQPSSRNVFIGEKLTVFVRVKNNGNATESFNVTLYYDSTPIQKETVHSLPPTIEQTILFEWNTSNVEEGSYTISAYAEPVPGETNRANNWLEDGTITVKRLPPSITHDIAVVWLSAEPTEVYVGENITIKITVLNLGNVPESFNVTAYYDSNIIHVIPVISLLPYTPEIITLEWNTTNVKPGVYTLGANATILEGETNIENNSFTDGKMTIKPILVLPFWTFLIPFLIGLAIIILLLIIYYLKKRKEKAITPPRYIVLLHPHI